MVRRITVALASVGIASAGLVAAAPAQAATCETSTGSAAACPTAGGIAASSWVVVPYSGSAPEVQLQASFNDPGNSLRNSSVQFVITGPGVTRTVYPVGPPTGSSGVKVYSATYRPSNIYKPGAYKVTASAQAYGDGAVTVTTGQASFAVRHQTRLTVYPSAYAPVLGSKIRFNGTLYPTVGAGGQKIKLAFKAKGTKGWQSKGKATVKANGNYKTKKQKMAAYGKWRFSFAGTSYLLKSKTGLVYKKI